MIVFLLEEPSMEALLNNILPKIPMNDSYKLIPHQGKNDLLRSIPTKLKAWTIPDTRFVIVHDQDSNDCMMLKRDIEEICRPYNRTVLIRIVCRELESWYFGDIEAVEAAYNKNLRKLKNSVKYRVPDSIKDPKDVIRRFIPELTQIDGAKRISRYMDINHNSSHSFNVFLEGIRKLQT